MVWSWHRRSVDVDVEGVEVMMLDAAAEAGVVEVESVGVEHHPNSPGSDQASKVVRALISSVGCDWLRLVKGDCNAFLKIVE